MARITKFPASGNTDDLAGLTARLEALLETRSADAIGAARELLLAIVALLVKLTEVQCCAPEDIANFDDAEVWQWGAGVTDFAQSELRRLAPSDAQPVPLPESGKGSDHYPTDPEVIAHSVVAKTLEQLAREGGAEPVEEPDPDPWGSPRRRVQVLFPNRSREPISRRQLARQGRAGRASRAPPSGDNSDSDHDSAGDGRRAGNCAPFFVLPGGRR